MTEKMTCQNCECHRPPDALLLQCCPLCAPPTPAGESDPTLRLLYDMAIKSRDEWRAKYYEARKALEPHLEKAAASARAVSTWTAASMIPFLERERDELRARLAKWEKANEAPGALGVGKTEETA